jgi:4-amino-4-deoxy-L-arabinose transferase-like glycosyltransferase
MKRFIKKNKKLILLAILILGAGVLLRLYQLTLLPIFADEAIYVRWAQVMRAEETLRFLPLSDGKQPLYMWSVIPFLKLFSDPLFAGRFLSVLSGIATIVGVFLVTKLLFKSQKIALIAYSITAISPFMVFFDRMALVDSMLAASAVWTFYLAALTAKTLRLDMAILTGFALGAAFLTKSPALFFAILLPLSILVIDWPAKGKEKLRTLLRFLFLAGVSLLIGYGMYNIMRLGPNFHLLSSRNLDYVYPYIHILETPLDPLVPHLKGAFVYFKLMGPWALLPLFVLGALYSLKARPKETFLVIAWILFPLLAQAEYAKVFTARYILFIVPFVGIIAASTFRAKKGIWGWGVGAIFIIFVLHSFYVNWLLLSNPEKATLPRSERSGYLEEWTAGTGIKEVSQYIKDIHTDSPDDKIVVGTEGYFGTLPDGLQIYLNDTPEIIVVGIGLGIDEVPKPLAESREAGNRTFLLVNSSRLGLKAKEAGLTLISAYPKAVKPDGGREALLLFELD